MDLSEQLTRTDFTKSLPNVISIERNDIAFSCQPVPSGWEVMVHVVDGASSLLPLTEADYEASSIMVGNIFTKIKPESLLFNKTSPRNSITTSWIISENFVVSPPTIVAGLVLLTDSLSRKEAELIVSGKMVQNVSFGSSQALRSLATITKRVSNIYHTNRLEWHNNKVLKLVDGKVVEVDDLLDCLVVCRYWTVEANAAAAQRIHDAFATMAVLYVQREPDQTRSANFAKGLKSNYGKVIDFTSKRSIRAGVFGPGNDPHEIKKLSMGISYLPSPAAYSVNLQEDLGHWNHDVRVYTNYTNPLSRYVDIIVQRQIISTLMPAACVSMTIERLSEICRSTNRALRDQARNYKETLQMNLAFQIASLKVPFNTHVFVKCITVEKTKAFINLESLDPNVKPSISTLSLSAANCLLKGNIKSIDFDKCRGTVKIHFVSPSRRPITIGLMSELYGTLAASKANVVFEL